MPSLFAHRLAQLHHLEEALADFLRARESAPKPPPLPAGYTLIRPPKDEIRDHPRLGRAAFARYLLWRFYLSRVRPKPAAVLRTRLRLRGLLLWRAARRRHAAKAPLPLSPLWRDRKTGAVRPVPRWLLEAPRTSKARRMADHLVPAAGKMIAPVGHPRPYALTTAHITRAGEGDAGGTGDFLTADETQAFWRDFFSDPVGFYERYVADFVDPVQAQAWVADYLADPVGWVLANKYAETTAGQAFADVPIGDLPLTPLLKDPQAFWQTYTDELYPSEDVSAFLDGQAIDDPIDFWAEYGDAADLSPEELAAATGPAQGDQTDQETIDATLAEEAASLALQTGLVVDGVLSDMQVLQMLDAYWARTGLQVGAAGALEDAGVAAGVISSWDIVNPTTLDYLRQQSGYRITNIDENTRLAVAQTLWYQYRGIDSTALPIDRLARALQQTMNALGNDLAGMSRYRALMIARTETARAVSFGTMVAYAKLGAKWVRWVVNAGACQVCIGNGEIEYVRLGESFPSGHTAPPAHPLCRCAISAIQPSEFNPADWTPNSIDSGDMDSMLFNPDYGSFPNVGWPTGDQSAPTPATAADLGLIDYGSLSPDLQAVLTPGALDALAAQLGTSVEDAASTWADENNVVVPETDAQLRSLASDPALADPTGLGALGDALQGTLDDWATEMDVGE